jgi:hypothetical protein
MHWIDPACLPETKGTITQFLLNPRGEADGFILDATRQVHFPPHLGTRVTQRVALGQTVIVRGVKPRAADMISAVSIAPNDGEAIVDEGPHHDEHEREPSQLEPLATELAGTIALSLYGPKGELRGALLDDGTSLRMSHDAADELQAYLSPGARVRAWGELVESRYGRTLEVSEIAHEAENDTGIEAGA